MSVKRFVQVLVFAFFLLVFLTVPVGVRAGGVCGGTYVVDAGDTLGSIAAKCGTTASAITTANPGVSDPLRAGQTLNLPVSGSSGNSVTTTIVSSGSTTTTTTTTTSSNSNYYRPPINYGNGTYIVQYGDTFSAIASRYGVTVNQLWAANPQIWNINWLYAGQLIYLPGSTNYSGNASATSVPLSYGNVPAGTPNGMVWLDNRSGGDIYVSLQGTTRDGIKVINEYPVSASMRVKVPAGWYVYVAWVGGRKYEGQFQLGQGSDRTIKFYNNKTSVN